MWLRDSRLPTALKHTPAEGNSRSARRVESIGVRKLLKESQLGEHS